MNRTTSFGIAAAAVLALAACDSKEDGRTAGQKLDQAIAEAKVAGAEAKESAERGLDKAAAVTREKSAEVARKSEELAEKAGAAAERAGERAGRQADDASITAAVKADLARDPDLSALRIDVDTHDGNVSLSGTAPSAAAKERATGIARAAAGVKAVDNRLEVAAR